MTRTNHYWVVATICLLFISCEKKDPITDYDSIVYNYTDDRDSTAYDIVVIGDQTWMHTNLQYESNDGISTIYDNDSTLLETNGRLYDLISCGEAAPNGWHIPTLEEWMQLIEFTGGIEIAGGRLKSPYPDHWLPPNTGATDTYHFTAVGAGAIASNGILGIGSSTVFWTRTSVEDDSNVYHLIKITHNSQAVVIESSSVGARCSIRCIKD